MSRYIFSDRLLVGVLFLLMSSVLFFRSQIVAETDMNTAIAKSGKLKRVSIIKPSSPSNYS